MGACKVLEFSDIGRAHFDCVVNKAQSNGIPINGDSGEAEKSGFKVKWQFVERDKTLHIQCVDSPAFVPCSTINSKISSLVEGCRPTATPQPTQPLAQFRLEKPRRVTVAASIDGVDDESWPDQDEYGHAEFTRETVLSDAQPQNVMTLVCRWGGECRVELALTGQIVDEGGAVRVDGQARLFEGTSEDSNDLDGETKFTFIVPRGKTVSNEQEVRNTDEGGDRATIKMSVNNSIVED